MHQGIIHSFVYKLKRNGARKQNNTIFDNIVRLVRNMVSIGFVVLGIVSAWPTLALTKFKHNETDVIITENEISYMNAMIPVGFICGSLATRVIADRFGRRPTVLGTAVPITIGSMIVVLTVQPWLLCVTAFAWNCGTGMLSTVIGCYLPEISDKDVRGTLSMITGIAFRLGNLIAMCVGPFVPYYALNYVMLLVPLCFACLCWWVPETPHFFLKSDNVDSARNCLRKLRRYENEETLEDELLEIQKNVKREMRNSSSFKELFTGVQYRKALIIASGLKMTHILTGGVAIRQYLTWIVGETKLQLASSWVVVIYGAITFVVSFMTSFLVDRVGRRPLLIYSYIGTGITLAIIGLYFFFKEIYVLSDILTTFAFIPFVGIILANIISTLGFNSLLFLIPAEIFPINVKTVALTSLNVFGAIVGAIVSVAYQQIQHFVGYTAVFWIFAVFSIGGGVFSHFMVTETKGKDLREIQEELQGKRYDVDIVKDKDDSNVEKGTELQELRKGD